jgi:DNA-directed RNA polymerase subunit RPC12/RpoP
MSRPYYRCGRCWTRKRLAKELGEYVRPPRCSNCGGRDWRVDAGRRREYRTRSGVFETCYCDRYSFPHRIGSGECWNRK